MKASHPSLKYGPLLGLLVSVGFSPSAVSQELRATPALMRFENPAVPGSYEVPEVRARGMIPDEGHVFVREDDFRIAGGNWRDADVSGDASLLRHSHFKKTMSGYVEVAPRSGLESVSATYRPPGEPARNGDCSPLALSIERQIAISPAEVLSIIEREISANPSCACEVLKSSLTTSDADAELAAKALEIVAITTPESLRLASQCVIAVVPESQAAIHALMARLDPHAGETGAKSGKDAKDVLAEKPEAEERPSLFANRFGNPLDLPPLDFPLPPPPLIFKNVTEVDRIVP